MADINKAQKDETLKLVERGSDVITEIDPESAEIKKRIEEIKKRQEEILQSKVLDLDKLKLVVRL